MISKEKIDSIMKDVAKADAAVGVLQINVELIYNQLDIHSLYVDFFTHSLTHLYLNLH